MVALKGADIEAFVAKPDPARPIVLVYGPDAGLVRERVSALLKSSVDDVNDPFALVQLGGDDLVADPARLADEATTIPLFGSRRAVWVKAGNKNFASALEALLAVALRDCRIVIEAADLRRTSPLRAMCERAKTAVALPCYVDGERELSRLIDEEMRSAKTTITPDARALLLPLLGGDRQASRSELTKLTLYAMAKSEIDVADVLAVVADAAALAHDGMIDAAFAGRAAEVDAQYAKARAAGTAPGTMLLAALRHVGYLHVARLAIETGTPITATIDRSPLGANFRRKPLLEAALRTWTADRLRRAMANLADAVRDSRMQSSLADAIAERTLLSIATAARRRA